MGIGNAFRINTGKEKYRWYLGFSKSILGFGAFLDAKPLYVSREKSFYIELRVICIYGWIEFYKRTRK